MKMLLFSDLDFFAYTRAWPNPAPRLGIDRSSVNIPCLLNADNAAWKKETERTSAICRNLKGVFRLRRHLEPRGHRQRHYLRFLEIPFRASESEPLGLFQETKRDFELQSGTGARHARELQTRTYLSSSVTHVVDAPMARLSATIQNCRINAFSIVPNCHFEFAKVIRQFDLDLRTLRMFEGIRDGFPSDPVNLIANNRADSNLLTGNLYIERDRPQMREFLSVVSKSFG